MPKTLVLSLIFLPTLIFANQWPLAFVKARTKSNVKVYWSNAHLKNIHCLGVFKLKTHPYVFLKYKKMIKVLSIGATVGQMQWTIANIDYPRIDWMNMNSSRVMQCG